MNPSSEGFAELREKILNQALPLLDSDTLPAEDRFRFSLQVAQMKGSLEAYTKAFQIAEKMEGDDKLLAYLDLLSDVDYVLQGEGEQSLPVGQPEGEPGRQDSSQASPADRIEAASQSVDQTA